MKKIAFQIDPLQTLSWDSDTSLALIETACQMGLEVCFYEPNSLAWKDSTILADIYIIENIQHNKYKTSPKEAIKCKFHPKQNLQKLDVIFIRQNPPFDMAYISSTFMLEKLSDQVRILNNPASIRNNPEKWIVTNFIHFMPETIITSNYEYILDFLDQHKKCVIKPLYGHGGNGIFLLEHDHANKQPIIENFLTSYKEPIIVQEFLPAVYDGDKRVLLIDGEVKAIINRIPQNHSIKSNLIAGGSAEIGYLSTQEQDMCQALAPKLKELGLFFVGIDIIGGKITEINTTSPTGLKAWQKLHGENLAEFILNKLLKS